MLKPGGPGPHFIKHEINNKMAVICWQPLTTQDFSSLYQLFQVEIDFMFYETGACGLIKFVYKIAKV